MHLRDQFFLKLYNYFKKGNKKKFLIITNDYGAPYLDYIIRDFPNFYINAGICEQNIITVACGFAKQGFRPIVYSISSFIIYRAFEQIKLDMLVHDLNVCLLTVGTGYAYDLDGPTHHTTEDLSMLNGFDNLQISCPFDKHSVSESFKILGKNNGPKWIRLDRGNHKIENFKFNFKNGNYLKEVKNKKLLIVTYGTFIHEILKINKNLLKNISLAVFLI